MLWEQGTQYEADIIARLKGEREVLDLAAVPAAERAALTLQALSKGVPLIYHGRLETEELRGEPDLLERLPNGEYLPVDIKSGMGREGADEENEGNYKKSYAVQLGLYTDALRCLEYAGHYRGAIWDSRGEIIAYDLLTSRGKRNPQSWWNFYETTLEEVKELMTGSFEPGPALGSTCALCEWKRTCKEQCVGSRCLSLIPELGRAKKELLIGHFASIDELAAVRVNDCLDGNGKTGIAGIGASTLEKFCRRAQLLVTENALPVILEPLVFSAHPIELFFDIEADPTRDIVYLHGVIERRDGDPATDRFHAFVAREATAAAEARVHA